MSDSGTDRTFAASGADWWARQDLNLRATGYEPGALPLSYGPAEG